MATTKYALPYPTLSTTPPDIPADIKALADATDAAFAGFSQNVFASRPAAGKAGRIFYATDTNVLYYDDGSAWHSVGALAAGSVTSSMILDATIVSGDIAADTITASNIAANAITSSELADNAVDTAAIADSAVTSAKIANGAIVDADVNAAAAIALTKLATIPVIGQTNAAYRVQGGSFDVALSGGGVGQGTGSVTFPAAYGTLGSVTCTPRSPGPSDTRVVITAESTTGFSVQVYGLSGETVNVNWIAYGAA